MNCLQRSFLHELKFHSPSGLESGTSCSREFTQKEMSSYKDKGKNLGRQYWTDRGHLVIQGGVDYSSRENDPASKEKEASLFALEKLEKYGFHVEHCKEALRATGGNMGSAYEFLISKYFNFPLFEPEPVDPNLLEERSQELDSIKSIYESLCEEKIPNQLWIIHLDLPYLADLFLEKPASRRNDPKDKRETCRFFFRGRCRFGDSCKYSHVRTPRVPSHITFDEKRDKFDLEIRFPAGCHYPLDPVIPSLTALAKDFPASASLKVTRRLIEEAVKYAGQEQCCVFALVELLKNSHEEIIAEVKAQRPPFYDPDKSLVAEEADNGGENSGNANDDHLYTEGKSTKKQLIINDASISRIDSQLVDDFKRKPQSRHYQDMLKFRRDLPAYNKMKEIVDIVRSNQVTVISGETGCGKSTQIPQFLLDDWLLNRQNDHVEIICTQPRKISAIGVAERVANERAERIGESVGYQIRLETRSSAKTRLMFCTTGILLRRLEGDPKLSSVSHVIVDEVHERSAESDFLLLVLRDLLQIRSDLKILLMSATLNSALFTQYYPGAPVIEIPGRTFPVDQIFLEDAVEMSRYILEEYSASAKKISKSQSRELEIVMDAEDMDNLPIKGIKHPMPRDPDEILPLKQLFHRYREYDRETCKTMFLMDAEKIDYSLVEHVLNYIVEGDHNYPKKGSILVFLPGLGEILSMQEQLMGNPIFAERNGKFVIVPLHSTLTNEEQALVFKKMRPGVRKVVLSTNIAETSITIDDCVFVVDCGKMKEKGFDVNKNMESLETVWVSRANADQRRGRAGRVMPGVCFHLFSRQRYDMVLSAQPVPEICRIPLEQLILRIKMLPALASKDLFHVIRGLIEPPAEDNITSAVDRLRHAGALDEFCNLTPLGKHLASLPVDVRVGKLILFGAMFSALDSALTIAACLSYKTPFNAPLNKREEAAKKKQQFVRGWSDHLTTLQAYKCWQAAFNKQGFRGAQNFAHDNFLSNKTLLTLADIKIQFLELLMDIGFVPGDIRISRRKNTQDRILEATGRELNAHGENQKLLSAILCAALYPNIVKVYTPDRQFSASISGAIPAPLKADSLVFKTKSDGDVLLHPSSVNYEVTDYPSPYLVYQEKVKTAKVFIRDCTMVPILPLVLFSAGALKVELNCGEFLVSIDDGWIIFNVSSNKVRF
ncbi:unnamed protein product [Nesidiocoris tenuis]|uniref:Putative ATP-dependent RNA helicase DHX57 n=1 Tax=Nesidiocoris tenuis TaxID=355587 RepID=A0A6H5GMY8_9HEMI|nr:unnamed protein product [Nesidiocoris tenuis]